MPLIVCWLLGAGAAAAGLLAVAPKTRHMVRQIFGQVLSLLQDIDELIDDLFPFIKSLEWLSAGRLGNESGSPPDAKY